jgi:hypothetical protein
MVILISVQIHILQNVIVCLCLYVKLSQECCMYMFKLHAVLRESLCGITQLIIGYVTIGSVVRERKHSLEYHGPTYLRLGMLPTSVRV